jgi:proprotein convertase subtilisin/kexin type 5
VTGTCPSGYYLSTPTCIRCKKECLTCSTGTTCDTCIIGYLYSTGGKCVSKCGDGSRDDNEQCDDGNPDNDDGCANDC